MTAEEKESISPLGEIAQGPSAFEQFLDRNQKSLAALAVLLVLAVAAYVVFRGVRQSAEETAGSALYQAEDLAELQDVIRKHAGTAAAGSAVVLLAERQWSEGQQDAAVETLRGFLTAEPDHPAVPTARASLGAKRMLQGQKEEATRLLNDVVEDPASRHLAPYALITLGDMAQADGDLERAEDFYNRARNDFSAGSFTDAANRRLLLLKAAMPIEIDPPPAPEIDPQAAEDEVAGGDFSAGLVTPPVVDPVTDEESSPPAQEPGVEERKETTPEEQTPAAPEEETAAEQP